LLGASEGYVLGASGAYVGLSGVRTEYGYAELGEYLQTKGAADSSILSVPHFQNRYCLCRTPDPEP